MQDWKSRREVAMPATTITCFFEAIITNHIAVAVPSLFPGNDP